MEYLKNKRQKRKTRHKRIRAKIFGSKEKPRLSVYRSNKNIYCQLVDDDKQQTLGALGTQKLFKENKGRPNKTDQALVLGNELGKIALAKGIKKIVFDRSGYKFHGRVKAIAEGIKKTGLKI